MALKQYCWFEAQAIFFSTWQFYRNFTVKNKITKQCKEDLKLFVSRFEHLKMFQLCPEQQVKGQVSHHTLRITPALLAGELPPFAPGLFPQPDLTLYLDTFKFIKFMGFFTNE